MVNFEELSLGDLVMYDGEMYGAPRGVAIITGMRKGNMFQIMCDYCQQTLDEMLPDKISIIFQDCNEVWNDGTMFMDVDYVEYKLIGPQTPPRCCEVKNSNNV